MAMTIVVITHTHLPQQHTVHARQFKSLQCDKPNSGPFNMRAINPSLNSKGGGGIKCNPVLKLIRLFKSVWDDIDVLYHLTAGHKMFFIWRYFEFLWIANVVCRVICRHIAFCLLKFLCFINLKYNWYSLKTMIDRYFVNYLKLVLMLFFFISFLY